MIVVNEVKEEHKLQQPINFAGKNTKSQLTFGDDANDQ